MRQTLGCSAILSGCLTPCGASWARPPPSVSLQHQLAVISMILPQSEKQQLIPIPSISFNRSRWVEECWGVQCDSKQFIAYLLYSRCLCYSLFLSTQTPELHAKASVCKHNKISSTANGNGRARMQIQERRSRSQPGPVPDFMVFLSCNMLQPVAMCDVTHKKLKARALLPGLQVGSWLPGISHRWL